MQLTAQQKEILNGSRGEGAAIAMKIQVAIGETFDAPRLVPITRAHVALSNQECDLWFAEKLVKAGAKCVVPPTVNPGFCIRYFQEKQLVDPDSAALMQRTHDAYQALGAVLTYNCTPYIFSNIPFYKEVISFSESSATPYVNSVWGARTNRESAQSALCAAITGYVPEYGLLLDENRKGNVLVEVRAKMDSHFKYQLLGYMGRKIGPGIPVFTGLGGYVSPESLMNLGAELNTSGAYGMYHIVGFTPEAPTLEAAFGGREPERHVVITEEDLQRVLEEEISDPGNCPVEFALFGCPHCTLDQIREIVDLIDGRTLKVPLWIMTSAFAKDNARKMGLLDRLQQAGGDLVEDTCSDQPCWHFLKGKVGVTDSPKLAYYPRKRGLRFVIRDMATCVDAAVKGEVI